MSACRAIGVHVLRDGARSCRRAGGGVVPTRAMARWTHDLDGETVARSHHPVRAVARRLWPGDDRCRSLARAAGRLVAAAAVHAHDPATLTVAFAHGAGLPIGGVVHS